MADLETLAGSRSLDEFDPLRSFRNEFYFPQAGGKEALYFAGHSLGLMPKKAKAYLEEELSAWQAHGVEGHTSGLRPWLPYHENVTESLASLVGAKPEEVVAMNSLTVNLHLCLVSFYRPTAKRYKILIENGTFPSDRYAVVSQARFHGHDPGKAIVELRPRAGEMTVSDADVATQIREHGDSLALVLLGNCNYLSGQCFDFENAIKAAKSVGAVVGFNLAHGAGNLELRLHDWEADFAVWCSYKYLNSGPGGIAGAFIHEAHLRNLDLPRFEGWWGHCKETRFKMGPTFDPIPTVEAWQLSNPPIFQLAALRASLDLFDRATMQAIRKKGNELTAYLQRRLEKSLGGKVKVVTPPAPSRGSMICAKLPGVSREVTTQLAKQGAFFDFREPDIVRMTPAPLYCSFEDVFRFVEALKEAISER